LRLLAVRSPEEALAWARGLDRNNVEHYLEAQAGYGQHGQKVDNVLQSKFPGVAPNARATANRVRRREYAAADNKNSAVAVATEPEVHPTTVSLQVAEVDRLDPNSRGDCIAAAAMLGPPVNRNGRPPSDVDRAIAEKFAGVPSIVNKLETLYPDGLPDPESEAAAWRSRGDADEAVASAERGVSDNSATAEREDVVAANAAHGSQGAAATERGIARTIEGSRRPVHRRTTTEQPVPGRGV
jgi:hypothetical protein